MAVLSIVQGIAARENSRELAINRLRGNAWAIAEGEREAFLIARHVLMMNSRNTEIAQIGPRCSEALADAREGSAGLINFTRADKSGRVRCSALPTNGDQTFADKSWWQRASKIDGLGISNPIIGQITKRPLLVMSLPVKDASGLNTGMITAGVSLEALQSSLDRRRAADPDAIIKIIGSRGNAILSNGNVGLDRLTTSPQAVSSHIATSRDGTEWLYSTSPLFGQELFVLYAKPRENLFAPGTGYLRQSIILPLIAMLLASLAIWFGTHRLVVRWLQHLQVLARQYGTGDFSGTRTSYSAAPMEVRELGSDLHAMGDALERRDKELTSALAAKTALTREVNHRVKNNLQIVTSLLTLQANRVADPNARNVLGQAKARISALGLIHRVMYQEDSENELGTVNMRLLVFELCPQLRASNSEQSGINLHCDCEDIEISVDQAVPLTLFIVEAVTNAFRHGYDNVATGMVTVRMVVEGSSARLSIHDDGSGYDVEDSVGNMGVELMQAFAGQLNGQLSVSSSAAGTDVTLTHPLTPY